MMTHHNTTAAVPQSLARPTHLVLERCLNQRHHDAGCQRCADFCPVSAIRLDENVVHLDEERCAGCGLCLHACPTEVFISDAGWHEETLPESLPSGAGGVTLICSAHPQPKAAFPGTQPMRLPACLAALSPGIWFELAAERPITARLDACSTCPLGLAALKDAILRALGRADAWLRACGHESRLSATTTPPETAGDAHLRQNGRQGMGRRSFLKSFMELAVSATFEVTLGGVFPAETVRPDVAEALRNPLHVPDWLRRLEEIYPRLYREAARAGNVEVAQWTLPAINQACAACGACAAYCPTEALTVALEDDVQTLRVKPGVCVACGLCVLACPTRAVTLDTVPVSEPFALHDGHQTHIVPCTRCQHPAKLTDGGLCFWCSQEPAEELLLSDARRQLLPLSNLDGGAK